MAKAKTKIEFRDRMQTVERIIGLQEDIYHGYISPHPDSRLTLMSVSEKNLIAMEKELEKIHIKLRHAKNIAMDKAEEVGKKRIYDEDRTKNLNALSELEMS